MEINIELIDHWKDIYSRLTNITRFASTFTMHKENVASHSFFVTYIAMMLCDVWNEESVDNQVDTERVLRIALLHDIEESFSGDLISSMKNRNKEFAAAVQKVNLEMMDEIFGEWGQEYKDLWAENKMTREGKIVHIADTLALLCYVSSEVDLGNRQMIPVFSRAIKRVCSTILEDSDWTIVHQRLVECVTEFYSQHEGMPNE